MNILKRSGIEERFDIEKVISALIAANDSVEEAEQMDKYQILAIAKKVEKQMMKMGYVLSVEEISDLVEDGIMEQRAFRVAKNFIKYRYNRALSRKQNTTDNSILALLERNNEVIKQENSNKNPIVNSVQRDYMAGEVSRDLSARCLVPREIWNAHKEGILKFHDADYFAQHMHNCSLVNLEDMLKNGTEINGTPIYTPRSFDTACTLATQIIALVASMQYGGQTISLAHLAPYVDVSRQKYRKEIKEELLSVESQLSDEKINQIAERRLDLEIERGVQRIQYQLITFMTTNGQAPFVSIFMYINEVPEGQLRNDLVKIVKEVLKQRSAGIVNKVGVAITPAFPKLIYVLAENNIRENSEYFWLTEMAAKCTVKRMVPDYISEKVMQEMKNGDVYGCMGCRSFLTVDRTEENIANALNYEKGKHKYYGRFNQGVVTINLVDVACSSAGDMDEFWKIFDKRLELCHKALRIRHERLLGTPSDVAPILWQNGALARLKKGEVIDKLLYNGYSTISLGYAGLCECVFYMLHKSHTDPSTEEFAKAVMQRMNDKCSEWKEAENIDYSVYGTPLESTTYEFAKCLQKRFGIIPGVTDKNYITNSYHVHVTEKIDAFSKLKFESKFQKLSPGGAISYVEVPNMQDNIPAVISLMQFMYENILYAEINIKSDYCHKCGYNGEIKIVDEHKKFVWECPNCGNRDQNMMSVARRTCGYIGTQFWNQGRTQEIKERVLHL